MSTPILVEFSHPSNWVQQRTTVNKNGEAGTVAANDYMKGDSAFLFVTPTSGGVYSSLSLFLSLPLSLPVFLSLTCISIYHELLLGFIGG